MRQSIYQNLFAAKNKAKEDTNRPRRESLYSKLARNEPQAQLLQEDAPKGGSTPRKADTDANDEKEGGGKALGFWCIPNGESYVKLKIKSHYFIGNKWLPNKRKLFSISRQNVEGKKVRRRVFTPIWPVLANLKDLSKYSQYSWVGDLVSKDQLNKEDPLFDPDNDQHLYAVQQVQRSIMFENWAFVIYEGGSNVHIGCNGSIDSLPYFKELMQEILLGQPQVPLNVRVDIPFTELQSKGKKFTVSQVGPDGVPGTKFSLEDVRQSMTRSAYTRSFDDTIKDIESDYDAFVSNAPKGFFEVDSLVKHFEAAEAAGGDKVTEFGKFLQHVQKNYSEHAENIQDAMDIYFLGDLEESVHTLTEMTFNQLWGLTRANGGYKYGGLKKTSKGWIYDVTVPDRMSNGSRFVVTRPPKMQIADDGNPQIAYNFKSRPDRSTTGMRQKGYVKFLYRTKKGQTSGKDRRSEWNRPCHVFCTCFEGSTRVLMSDGTYKPIRDISIGDEVFTHKGRIRKVTNTNVRPVLAEENVYKLKFRGHPDEVTVTGNHPYLLLRGNDECLCGCGKSLYQPNILESMKKLWSIQRTLDKKFHRGHYRSPQKLEDKSGGYFDWVDVDNFRPREWGFSPWITHEGTLDVGNDFARLVGYYAAEGNLPQRGHQTVLTFSQDEKHTLVADVESICAKLGYQTRVSDQAYEDRKWTNVHITSKDFREFLKANVRCGSANKRFSEQIMTQWCLDNLKHVFIGATLGDGSVANDRGRANEVSKSFHLVSQLQTILRAHGIKSMLSHHHKEKEMWQVQVAVRDSHLVREWLKPYGKVAPNNIIESSNKYMDYIFEGGHLATMTSCEKSDFKGHVYDITVEEDESFIVQGVAVHNCPDFKYRWHAVLFKAGASHKPKGGAESNGAFPSKTNPSGKLCLCKHLIGVANYLSMSKKDLDKYFKEIDEIEKAGVQPQPSGGPPNVSPTTTPKVNVI